MSDISADEALYREGVRRALREMRDRIIYLDGRILELARILDDAITLGAATARQVKALQDLPTRRAKRS